MKNKKILIYFHNKDLDGKVSGAIVYRYYIYDKNMDLSNIELKGIDYDDEFDLNNVYFDDEIIMVDFSLEPFEKMIELKMKCSKLIWIDHHISILKAIEDYAKKKYITTQHVRNEFGGVININKAACELCWEYFYPEKEIPIGVKWIGKHDRWKWMEDDRILPYHYGLLIEDTEPTSDLWSHVFEDDFEHLIKMIKKGREIIKFIDNQNKWLMKKSFEIKFEEVKFKCINHSITGPKLFDFLFEDPVYGSQWDALMVFYMTINKKWSFHMCHHHKKIGVKIDLSKIARKYGGGGHFDAAGFQLDYIPFELK